MKTVAEHREAVKQAGCLHPAVFPNGILGFCKLCRVTDAAHVAAGDCATSSIPTATRSA